MLIGMPSSPLENKVTVCHPTWGKKIDSFTPRIISAYNYYVTFFNNEFSAQCFYWPAHILNCFLFFTCKIVYISNFPLYPCVMLFVWIWSHSHNNLHLFVGFFGCQESMILRGLNYSSELNFPMLRHNFGNFFTVNGYGMFKQRHICLLIILILLF